jgi:drug/metabolite transporter (DMT)-like permease
MAPLSPRLGIALAFICLVILGVMPIISNGRPPGSDALTFALYLSFWQLLFSIPLFARELRSNNKGIFRAGLSSGRKARTLAITVATGAIFGLSTYVYVLAFEKAGAVSAAIALQAYPLFAMVLEAIFFGRKKSRGELFFTLLIIAALYYLATSGTWRIDGFSFWSVSIAVPGGHAATNLRASSWSHRLYKRSLLR